MELKARLLFALLICGVWCPAAQATIKFYKHKLFKGRYYESNAILEDGCLNLPQYMDNNVLSIQTNKGCVVIFDEKNCEGKSLKVAPGTYAHYDMGQSSFADIASSFKICEVVKPPEYSFYNGTNQKDHLLDYRFICGCTNLPEFAIGQISSVNTNDKCLQLYSDKNCGGIRLQLTKHDNYDHGKLEAARFNDMAASINICGGAPYNCGKDNSSSCAEDQFSCIDGACIGMNRVCDEILDCSDRGDEDRAYCVPLTTSIEVTDCSGGEESCAKSNNEHISWILAIVIVGSGIGLIAILILIVYLYKRTIHPYIMLVLCVT